MMSSSNLKYKRRCPEIATAYQWHQEEEQKKTKNKKTKKTNNARQYTKRVREKARKFHNHKPQPFPDTERKSKQTNQTTQIEQT